MLVMEGVSLDPFSGSLINHFHHSTFPVLQLQAAGNNKVLVSGAALHLFDLKSADQRAAAAALRSTTLLWSFSAFNVNFRL